MTALATTATAARGHVRLDGISHRYGATTTLDRLDLDVPAGSFTVVVGPSGSGKSTVLQIVAGLLTAAEGTVTMDGVDLTHRPPGRRDLAMVFQDYALYPHMSARDNIAFALRLDARHRRTTMRGPDIDRAVHDVAARLGIDGLLDRLPGQLSGGQRQRVAIARALVRRPAVLLLDEPLSAIDAQLRHQTRTELQRLHAEIGATVVLVTHDQTEALSLATHLVLLDHGRVVQAGPPQTIYDHPNSLFTARFLGNPPINVLPAATVAHLQGAPADLAGDGHVGWRPHAATATPPNEPAITVDGRIELTEFTGDAHLLHCSTATPDPCTWTTFTAPAGQATATGDPVRRYVPLSALHRFDADGAASPVPVDGLPARPRRGSPDLAGPTSPATWGDALRGRTTGRREG